MFHRQNVSSMLSHDDLFGQKHKNTSSLWLFENFTSFIFGFFRVCVFSLSLSLSDSDVMNIQ